MAADTTPEPDALLKPDYSGGSIVNLMTSIIASRGGTVDETYPSVAALDGSMLSEIKNLVLIVIDGMGYDFLVEEQSNSFLTAKLTGRLTSVFPSTTATAITTFLTGLAPQQHALTGWFTYFGELGGVATTLLCQTRMGATPLSKAGVDLERLFDHTPVFDRIDTESHVIAPARIAYSPFNTAHSGKANIHPYETLKGFFERISAAVRGNNERKYIYAYWGELDHLAHDHGIRSQTARSHFRLLDVAIERFLGEFSREDTLIIITADHGMLDSGPDWQIEVEDHPVLQSSLTRPLCGERRASYCYVQPERREQFERYITETLSDQIVLRASEDLVQQDFFGLGTPHARLRERIGDYTLLMKDRFTIKDWVPGERKHAHIGTHGGVSSNEMYVPLILIGG